MIIDKNTLDGLTAEAVQSPRKRMNRDMRNTENDTSQRMLNALDPDTVLPIHRHRATSETVIILRGAAEEIYYDDNGNVTARYVMRPNSNLVGLNIPAGQWHSIVSLEAGTVIFEAKDGIYRPTSDDDILTPQK